jgi:hypothetical protein
VFPNSPCRETPKKAQKKIKKKEGTYVLFFASWRRCTSFSRFIFSAAPCVGRGTWDSVGPRFSNLGLQTSLRSPAAAINGGAPQCHQTPDLLGRWSPRRARAPDHSGLRPQPQKAPRAAGNWKATDRLPGPTNLEFGLRCRVPPNSQPAAPALQSVPPTTHRQTNRIPQPNEGVLPNAAQCCSIAASATATVAPPQKRDENGNSQR